MNTIFMNSKNSKTSDPRRLLLNLTDINRSDKFVATSNLSMYHTWKTITKSYKNNKFKISSSKMEWRIWITWRVILYIYQVFKIYSILNKVNKTIGLLRKFQLILPRHSLITIYKTFTRPHIDYGDVIYDHAFNESFH